MNWVSSRKPRIPTQASSEQEDAQSRPQVSRVILSIVMLGHAYPMPRLRFITLEYITC